MRKDEVTKGLVSRNDFANFDSSFINIWNLCH